MCRNTQTHTQDPTSAQGHCATYPPLPTDLQNPSSKDAPCLTYRQERSCSGLAKPTCLNVMCQDKGILSLYPKPTPYPVSTAQISPPSLNSGFSTYNIWLIDSISKQHEEGKHGDGCATPLRMQRIDAVKLSNLMSGGGIAPDRKCS